MLILKVDLYKNDKHIHLELCISDFFSLTYCVSPNKVRKFQPYDYMPVFDVHFSIHRGLPVFPL